MIFKDAFFFRFWWISLAVQLLIGALVPLVADETYYWVWSHNLQLSYYDHPPFVSWLFLLGHPFEGLGHAVRWPAIIFGHLTILIIYHIFRDYFSDENQRFWWLLVLCLNPLTGWGSLIITPDIPLLVFWTLSLLCLIKYLKNPNWPLALLLGASLGLGFCSKYQIIVFLPLLAVYLTVDRLWSRVQLNHVLGATAVGLLFTLPVVIWNIQTDFISFRFQIDHGLGAETYQPGWTFEYILGQFALISPALFVALFRKTQSTRPAWISIFSWGPIIFFLLATFKGRSEANWPIAAYPVLLSFACLNVPSIKWLKATVSVWVAILLVVLSEIFFPWIPLPPGKLKTYELRAYDSFTPLVDSYTPFYASSFQMASMLSYKTKIPVFKIRDMGRKDFFDFLPQGIPTTDEFFAALNSQWDVLPKAIQETYEVRETILLDQERRLLWMRRKKR